MNKTTRKHFPIHGWIGLLLIILFWILNWSLDGLRTQWGFFPLWLGYALFVDALVLVRKGTSLLERSRTLYVSLFLISMPAWWVFELYNLKTQNWFYDGHQYFSNIEYFLFSSLSFSTVMPAVFGTAELTGTFKWIKNIPVHKKIILNNKTLLIFFGSGILILLLIILFPKVFYPFVWVSIFLLIEPLNAKLGNKSILKYISAGEWSPLFALALGGLICGFFWEMWNYFSYPKWKYYLPGVNILHIFEMPLPGYIGYLPFPFELFAIYYFLLGFFKSKKAFDYFQL